MGRWCQRAWLLIIVPLVVAELWDWWSYGSRVSSTLIVIAASAGICALSLPGRSPRRLPSTAPDAAQTLDNLLGRSDRHRAWRASGILMAATTVLTIALAAQVSRIQIDRADRAVCRAMQRLDGASYNADADAAIRSAGRRDPDKLGYLARAADGQSWPGHLSMASDDYGYVLSRCYRLGVPAPNVD